MRKERGITLVSLVITIIVLIILAGVSINLTLGENGIITIAKQAKENIELAKIEEEKALNELYMQMESDSGSSDLNYDAIALLKDFKKKIALAITNEGVETLETDTADTMSQNIGKIKENSNNELKMEYYASISNVNSYKLTIEEDFKYVIVYRWWGNITPNKTFPVDSGYTYMAIADKEGTTISNNNYIKVNGNEYTFGGSSDKVSFRVDLIK